MLTIYVVVGVYRCLHSRGYWTHAEAQGHADRLNEALGDRAWRVYAVQVEEGQR